MKLDFVEIAGFRGFRDKTRFDLPPGFAVLCGRNGAGKSTVLDAIDFALTGTINKFSVRTARGGGLEDHIWWVGSGTAEASYVSVGFVDDNGQRFIVKRLRDGTLAPQSNENISRLCRGEGSSSVPADTLMQTSLIRDESIVALSLDLPEQARFAAVKAAIGGLVGPDYSPRTADIQKAATEARDRQKTRFDAAQAELGRALTSLTEARSAAERSPDIADALRTIESLSVDLPADPNERTEALRRLVADQKTALRDIEEARRRVDGLLPEVSYLRSPNASALLQAKKAERDAAARAKTQTDAHLALAVRAEEAEQESDRFASHLAALVEHGTALGLQDGHCPLCAAFRSTEEFNQAIASARSRLADRSEKLASAAAAVREGRTAVDIASLALKSAQEGVDDLESRRAATELELASVREVYERYSFDAPIEDIETAQRLLLREQERLAHLERALFIIDVSSAVDRISSLEARIISLRNSADQEAAKLAECENTVETARQIDSSAKTVANQILTEQFDTVMPLLKELYRRLRPHAEWLEIESDFGGRVRGSLNFTVGNGHNVQFLFSSGQRRAAGLAFLLAIHLSRKWCNWQSLLLDDPVQHIDDYRALNLVEVLAAVRRTGRQVVVAVEDVALADVLCRRLRSSIGEIGRRFELHASKSGTAEIASTNDIFPMPREVLRPAQVS